MRLTVADPQARHYHVYLNGERVHGVVEADTIGGWIKVRTPVEFGFELSEKSYEYQYGVVELRRIQQ